MNVTIIGTGYVGLVTGICLAEIGHNVVCIDNNHEKVEKLSAAVPTIYEIGLPELLKKHVTSGNISFTSDFKEPVNNSDLIFIAVGTPEKDSFGETDLSYVLAVTKAIAQNADHSVYVVIKSTAPVGTADKMKEEFNSVISSRNLKGVSIFISSNPEFLKEGTAIHDFMHPDRIVIGTDDEESEERLSELYKAFEEDKHVPVLYTNVASAQIIKYASNAFNACKISFINSLTRYCEEVGADITDIAEGMGLDKRIGRAFLNAGIGYGGSCFPKDISSLEYEINKHGNGYKSSILPAIRKENDAAIYKPCEILNHLLTTKKISYCSTIAILGLAFKPNTDDVRYSPALEIISDKSIDFKIRVYDPIAMENAKRVIASNEEDYELENIYFANSIYDAVEGADAVIVCTEWDEFKKLTELSLNKIHLKMAGDVFIDGRNIFDPEKMSVLFDYYCVGKPHISK